MPKERPPEQMRPFIDAEHQQPIRELAVQTGRTQNAIVNEAVQRYLEDLRFQEVAGGREVTFCLPEGAVAVHRPDWPERPGDLEPLPGLDEVRR